MLILKIVILLILLLIFLQDLRSRTVYWFLFPLLAVLLICLHLQQGNSPADAWQASIINLAFIGIQLLFLTVYFSVKSKRIVNISSELLGLGDILFLLSIAFYLSVLNFLFFYVISLFIVLATWLVWQLFSANKNKQIPLAGLQAMFFSVFLALDWYVYHWNITADGWLLNLIYK